MTIFHSGYSKTFIFSRLAVGKIHFVGVCGVSMSALAKYLAMRGYAVTGSDRSETGFPALMAAGVRPTKDSSPRDAARASLLVYSLAVAENHPDLVAARLCGVPAVSRAELLGAIAGGFRLSLSVSGSHGKSTTTGMLDAIASAAGKEHTTFLGADGDFPCTSGRELLIFESCEYRDSFLYMPADVGVFLNVEWDHTDYFKTAAQIEASFLRAAGNAGTASVLVTDDEILRKIAENVPNAVTVGENPDADFRIENVSDAAGYYRFSLSERAGVPLPLTLSVPGEHQVKNAAAAAACALTVGFSREQVQAGIAAFGGIARRLERLGEYRGHAVYYDYAHHPTELSALIRTLRQMENSPVTVVFRPHTYSRTAAFFDAFADALSCADYVILEEIDAVREDPVLGVSARNLAGKIGAHAVFAEDAEAAVRHLVSAVGCIVIAGAGNQNELLSKIFPARVDKRQEKG